MSENEKPELKSVEELMAAGTPPSEASGAAGEAGNEMLPDLTQLQRSPAGGGDPVHARNGGI